VRRAFIALTIVAAAACSGSSAKQSGSTNAPTSPSPSTTAPATSRTPAPDLSRVDIRLAAFASGLDSPVAVAFRPRDTHMFVAEQSGRVRIVDASGRLAPDPVLTVGPLSHGNEEGLLGITFSPDGSKLYVDYTDPSNDTHVDEYRMRGDAVLASTHRRLLVVEQPNSNHKGGQVVTGPDGMLYVGLGDGGSEGDPNHIGQNLGTLLAKILRIDPNPSGSSPYSVPADNPFVGRKGAAPETWMWGLRNPWRFSFDRATGDLWIGDVGQDKYEEIDFARRGERGINWGWSAREGFHPYRGPTPAGARDPLLETRHSQGNCAVVGGYVYRGGAIPALRGVYLFGDNCRPNIVGVVASGGKVLQQRDLGPTVSELTSFGEDDSGELYALARDGTIYRIVGG
jgi:glucose/arabinose dehydrogenase